MARTIEEMKSRRLAMGLTQTALAGAIGTKPQMVNKWENGVARPGPKFYPRLAKLFKLSPHTVVDWFAHKPATA